MTVSYIESIEEFNYVVIKTDYTARIAEEGRFKKEFNKLLDKYTYSCDEDTYDKAVELLFVVDTLWGKGEYKLGANVLEVDTMIDHVKVAGLYESGIACFRCNQNSIFSLVNVIFKGIYCRIFEVERAILFVNPTNSSVNIKYVKFDTESG
jgi:hypothetical protein